MTEDDPNAATVGCDVNRDDAEEGAVEPEEDAVEGAEPTVERTPAAPDRAARPGTEPGWPLDREAA